VLLTSKAADIIPFRAVAEAILVNSNDSNTNQVPDNGGADANSVNGTSDVQDLGVLTLKAMPNLPDDLDVILRLAGDDANRIRVFDKRATDGTAILGPGEPAEHTVDRDTIKAGDITLGIEGIEYGGTSTVSLVLRKGTQDKATYPSRVEVAPLLLMANTESTEKLMFCLTVTAPLHPGLNNNDFVSSLRTLFPTAAFRIEIPRADHSDDAFPQDALEVGYSRAGTRTMRVVLDLPSGPGLDGYPQKLWRAHPSYGYCLRSDDPPGDPLGGNIEVSPPVRGFPHGRIVVGSDLQAGLKTFFKSQRAQAALRGAARELIELDVAWLIVGHVDEVACFVPFPNAGQQDKPFKLVMGSLSKAIDVLRSRPDQEVVPSLIEGNRTVAEILQLYWDENTQKLKGDAKTIQDKLNANKALLAQGLGLAAGDIVEVPVLYTLGIPNARTAVPNAVNMQVVGNRVLVPEQWYSPFADAIKGTQQNPGVLRQVGLTVEFLDDRVYHVQDGDVHCATYAIRQAPAP
jgi:hypothetical protein